MNFTLRLLTSCILKWIYCMQGCIYAYIALPLTFLYLLGQILYTTDLMLVVHKSRNKNKRENLFFTYYIKGL